MADIINFKPRDKLDWALPNEPDWSRFMPDLEEAKLWVWEADYTYSIQARCGAEIFQAALDQTMSDEEALDCILYHVAYALSGLTFVHGDGMPAAKRQKIQRAVAALGEIEGWGPVPIL